jgi:hypothetical protein
MSESDYNPCWIVTVAIGCEVDGVAIPDAGKKKLILTLPYSDDIRQDNPSVFYDFMGNDFGQLMRYNIGIKDWPNK